MLFKKDEVVPAFIAAAAGSITMIVSVIKNKLEIDRVKMALFLLPPALGVIYWFYMTPSIRFVGALLYILGFGMLAFAIYGISGLLGKKIVNILIAAYIVISIFNGSIFRPWSLNINIIPAGTDKFGLYSTPKEELKEFVTRSGLTLYVPVTGEKCWDAPLPCTPYPNRNLKLRRADDMRHGFVFDPRDDSNPEYGTRNHELTGR